jgi:OPA family glycerol-3-phosphate transporter-like MFS transporter
MGAVAINNLAPIILAGFAIGAWTLGKGEWRWLFRLPPIMTAVMAVLVALIPKETPDEAGYPGQIHDELSKDASARTTIRESFTTIFKHPLVWWYALAYACTGSVRHSSDQLSVLYFEKQLGLDMNSKPAAVFWTLGWGVPLVAVAGSLISGWVSDKFFQGHRSPVALGLYFGQSVVIGLCALVINLGIVGPTPGGIILGCLFLCLISFMVNSTHSLVGAAAPMDIGGRKMAGFASGVIDSFQYYGAAITLPVTGWLLKKYGWGTWYPSMAAFGIIGGCAMLMVMRKQKKLGHFDLTNAPK